MILGACCGLLLIDCGCLEQSSPFFTEQLTAFQVWLALGSNDRQPPEQLPIVLQVGFGVWFLLCVL